IASAPAISAAAMMRGMLRYDSRAGAGPMQTSSSAKRTWRDSRSASEYTATVWMLNSRQALMTRKAISPRFAINTFLNTDAHRHTVKLKTKGTERVPDVSSVVASDRFTTPRLPSMAFKAQADVLALNGAGISLGVVN